MKRCNKMGKIGERFISKYKSEKTVGGVYMIKNKVTDKILIEHARNIHGIEN